MFVGKQEQPVIGAPFTLTEQVAVWVAPPAFTVTLAVFVPEVA
jgi:hypothetical protein